jgi:hypothetical protein
LVWREQLCTVEVGEAAQTPAAQAKQVSVQVRVPVWSQTEPKPPHAVQVLVVSSQVDRLGGRLEHDGAVGQRVLAEEVERDVPPRRPVGVDGEVGLAKRLAPLALIEERLDNDLRDLLRLAGDRPG